MRAEEGAALADEVDEDEGAAAAGVGALVVYWGRKGGRLVFSFRIVEGFLTGSARGRGEDLLMTQARMLGMVENTPADARKVAKYRTPTVLTVARTM